MRASLLFFAFGLFLGCESELTPPTSEAVSLIDVHAWHLVAVSEDPFDDRPETSSCPATGYGVEDGFFEVETDVCHYGTFMQPSLLGVSKETTLRLILALASEQPRPRPSPHCVSSQ